MGGCEDTCRGGDTGPGDTVYWGPTSFVPGQQVTGGCLPTPPDPCLLTKKQGGWKTLSQGTLNLPTEVRN